MNENFKKGAIILYFLIFIIFGCINLFYPLNKLIVLTYSVLTTIILIKCESMFRFKINKNIKNIAIIYIILVLIEFFIEDFISPMISNSPQNHVFIFLSSLSILTIYKILKYKKYEWKKALFIYSVFFSPHQNLLFQIKYLGGDHLQDTYTFLQTT